MDSKSMDPYGQALLDFHNGGPSATITVHRDDGYVSPLPAAVFFRKPAGFSDIEKDAIELCTGDVLDIGAGTGCHSLALQERGANILAIEISPQAAEIMKQRGVAKTRLVNVYELHGGPYDTLLMMMHGIGMVETLSGLDRFLRHARTLVKEDGRLLLDSLDVRRTDDPKHRAYQEANRRAGRYFGEIRMQFEYKGVRGPLFGWLHVDAETLADHAGPAGWECRIIRQQEDGNYLAQLSAKSGSISRGAKPRGALP
ncbi:MAG: methyltransferase domain-containing protein [Anaerolineales bacterium]|nr:methyltransferase domain-containing protein [Anaerolineales bacterium]